MKLAITMLVVGTLGFSAFAQEEKKEAPKQDGVKTEAPKAKEEAKPARKMGLAKPIVLEKDNEVYGAKPTLAKATGLADLLKDPKAQEGKTIRVDGEVEGVCVKKGCWMTLKDGDKSMRVKFKDYAFFVPFDIAGRTATVEGKAEVMLVTEAMRRHYAMDAGKSKEEVEKIKGDETTVTFMAEAVKIGGAPVKKDGCCEGEVEASGEVKKPVEGKKDGCAGCSGEKKDDAKKDGCSGCTKKEEVKKEEAKKG